MTKPYWDKDIETISRDELQAGQLKDLRKTVFWALRTPFYKRRLERIGLTDPEDIKQLEDIKQIPFTTKDDLRDAFPEGLLSVSRDECVRLHTSSGTTGTPTVIYHTPQDLNHWTELGCRCVYATGCTRGDVLQNMMTYGLFTGGLGLHYAAERAGLLVIPASSGNTARQLKLMKDFRTTVLHATPSYLLHLQSHMDAHDFKRSDFQLKKAFVGAEPHSEHTRLKIEQLLNIDVYNSYGLSEMNGPCVAFECTEKADMHIWEDNYLLEMIDSDSGADLGEDADGELVMTTLKRTATPLLRYRTKDLTRLISAPCPCGRTHRRIARIKGRSDDMLILNGVNMYPSQVESILMQIPEVGTNYQMVVRKEGALDRLIVKTEIYAKLFTGEAKELERLKAEISGRMKASVLVNPIVELHEPGSLPVSEGKAQRVFDERPVDA